MPQISLREVNQSNHEAVLALRVAPQQRRFIADNGKTLAQAAVAPEAWLRAIYADEMLVGLLFLHDEHLRTPPREQGYYFLWRLMIDAAHQRKGYARKALELLIAHVSTRPHAKRLLSSYIPGTDGPELFYLHCGFKPTCNRIGEDIEVEIPVI